MILDLTKTIVDQMAVYDGDPEVSLKQIADITRDGYQNSLLTINMHAGTHVDGLAHMLENKPMISEYPLDRFIGLARYVNDNEAYINQGESILVVNMQDSFLNKAFVESIIKTNIQMIVIEKDSVDQPPYDIHKLLFSHGIMIVENAMDIDRLKTLNIFKLYAIPLKIYADASPVRLFVEY